MKTKFFIFAVLLASLGVSFISLKQESKEFDSSANKYCTVVTTYNGVTHEEIAPDCNSARHATFLWLCEQGWSNETCPK